MPVTGMLLEGLQLLVIGMGIVYAFLLLQVGLLTLVARLVRRIEGPPPALVGPAMGQDASGPAGPEVVAAVTAAVHRYRAEHRRDRPT